MRASCCDHVAPVSGTLCEYPVCGDLLRWLVSAGDHDHRNLARRNKTAQGDALALEHLQVIRHRGKALRLTPEGLHDGMNIGWKLPNLTDKPLERPRCRRTKDPDEPPR